MKYTDLKNSIEKDGLAPVYLLEGEDGYFLEKGEDMIKNACLQMPELNLTAFEGSSLKSQESFSQLDAAIQGYPFCSEKRVVKITDFYPTEDVYLKQLKSIFENIPDTTLVLIINSQSKKHALKNSKLVTFVDCSKADEGLVAKWIYNTLRHNMVNCSEEAAIAVARYCVLDMSRVALETEKLLSCGKDRITLADVDLMVYKDADYRTYELTSTIPKRNYTKFCTIMDDLLLKGFDNAAIISIILNYLKNLYSALCTTLSDNEYAANMRMKPFVVKRYRGEANAIGKSNLEALISDIYKLISDAKGGLLSMDAAMDCVIGEIFFKRA